MKYLIITALLFFTSLTLFAQNLDDIKKTDVLIVYFENDRNSFVGREYDKKKNNIETILYKYYSINNEDNTHTLVLCYRTYMDFDAQFKGEKALVLPLNKSFLRKNKDIILTKKFMDKIGFSETLSLFSKAKTILLIDNNDSVNNKLVLKEVKYFNTNPIE
ncbi:hypothetical protein [Wocania ichthyoenteri]|uniref:hypothetical protein n=1 Tax=Wocania ichthyoenteri TaxID=1230531 RepID=UPI00053F1347|nr:hypothetical protein [Wocania ichthyoenteri]